MRSKVLIIGTGAWGTALGSVLAKNQHDVYMYGTNIEQINDLKKGKNDTFFKDIKLNFTPSIITNKLEEVIKEASFIFLVIPTNAYYEFVKKYKKLITTDKILVIASKGIEPKTQLSLVDFLRMYFPKNEICSVLGPGFALEVIKEKPTFLNAISNNIKTAKKVEKLLNNKNFLVEPIVDEKGAGILASFKNALAILFGLLSYQNISSNTKSAILTLAIKEMNKYIIKEKGSYQTTNEFCGIGDIFLTCTDALSRNYQFGYNLGKDALKTIKNPEGITVEGYKFINSFFKNKKNKKNQLIIFHAIYLMLNNKIKLDQIVDYIWDAYYEQKSK